MSSRGFWQEAWGFALEDELVQHVVHVGVLGAGLGGNEVQLAAGEAGVGRAGHYRRMAGQNEVQGHRSQMR